MDAVFPFGFPFATAFYLTLYVLTLAIHVLFMNYVLAGTAYMAVSGIRDAIRGGNRQSSTIIQLLNDLMHFALGATITAGVAPLLFLQILFQKNFYTANLLLLHRWMAILPVLILGFYLLYLVKARRAQSWPPVVRAAINVGAFLCVAFTGLSWTENHLLSLDSGVWARFYESGAILYRNPELIPRLALWSAGAVPTLAILLAWQLRHAANAGSSVSPAEWRKLAVVAWTALILCSAAGVVYYLTLPGAVQRHITGRLAGPYLILAAAGLLMEAAVWGIQYRSERLSAKRLAVATAGLILSLVGMTVVREAIRLARLDIAGFYATHAQAAKVGGLPAFLIFLVINAILIAVCFILILRCPAKSADETP